MASMKALLVFATCALLFTSASAQVNTTAANATIPANATAANATIPANATTAANATTPANLTTPVNATLAPVLNTTTAVLNASAANATQLPSPAVLAIYQAVKARGLGLLSALSSNIVALPNFVSPDVALVLPNTTAPVTLSNTSVLIPFYTSLTPPAGSNASASNISELSFYVVDSSNVVTVYEITAGQLGNVYITGFWQLLNSTTSTNGSWSVAYASIAPAPTTPFTPQTFPIFGQTPNITILTPNSTLNNNATANSTAALNSTSLFVNSSSPVNTTIEAAVVAASTAFQTAIGNASLSLANVTSQFLAPNFTVVVPLTKSPVALNVTDPTIVGLFGALRATNGSNQSQVAYKQLNPQAAVLTTQVAGVPVYGNVYFIQLWQLLNASTGSNTTTGINTTIIANRTTAPVAQSWQLTFASLNIAPSVAGSTPVLNGTLLAPAPAPGPGTSSVGALAPAPGIPSSGVAPSGVSSGNSPFPAPTTP